MSKERDYIGGKKVEQDKEEERTIRGYGDVPTITREGRNSLINNGYFVMGSMPISISSNVGNAIWVSSASSGDVNPEYLRNQENEMEIKKKEEIFDPKYIGGKKIIQE